MVGGRFTLEFRKLISDIRQNSNKEKKSRQKNSNKDLRAISAHVVVTIYGEYKETEHFKTDRDRMAKYVDFWD